MKLLLTVLLATLAAANGHSDGVLWYADNGSLVRVCYTTNEVAIYGAPPAYAGTLEFSDSDSGFIAATKTNWNAIAVSNGTVRCAGVVVPITSKAAAEVARQAAKSDALKTVENQFLDICQQLTGQRVALGFAALDQIVTGLMATDPNAAVALSLRLLTLDAAGKREGGLKWWDDISDHEEIR